MHDSKPDNSPKRLALADLQLLAGYGLRLVWHADRSRLTCIIVLYCAQAAGLGVSVLIVRNALAVLTGESGGQPQSLQTSAAYVALLLAMGAVNSFIRQLAEYQQALLRLSIERDAVQQVVSAAATFELAEFENAAFHDRIQLALQAAQGYLPQLPALLASALRVLMASVAVGAALTTMAWWLFPLLIVSALPTLRVALWRQRVTFTCDRQLTENSRTRRYLTDLLTGRHQAKEIRAFGLAQHLFGRLSRCYDQVITEQGAVRRRVLRFEILARLASDAMIVAALAIVIAAEASGRLSTASSLTAVACLVFTSQQALMISMVLGGANASAFHLDALRQFTAHSTTQPPRVSTAASMPPVPAFALLEARNVSFTYPAGQKPALKDVSIQLRAGETVALVGENGSGKTTLTKLLAGLYRPDAGQLLIDGKPVTDPTLLTAASTVLFQDYLHYWMTAGENISLGDTRYLNDEHRTVQAARTAGAHDAITALPAAYRTQLGPQFTGGSDLSPGQWQRIALARAFFRNAPLIILDEPTASMDPLAEADLFDRMQELFAERTVLLISHRFSSVLTADRIYVLEGGHITETGTHNELMTAGGTYRKLYLAQASAYMGTADNNKLRSL
ncbi:ABC transporter ATP-binding protein [Streptomyces lavendofoliae]|uniref:ABC transporter ATP-binding protein n=1 Tax=Streptomyces lavendofoliae TaxID=67314 RepID=UPI00300F70E8